jgi:hypothetical protein
LIKTTKTKPLSLDEEKSPITDKQVKVLKEPKEEKEKP